MLPTSTNYNLVDQKILIGLSGGINSMAVLCWLVQSGIKPKELHLYYAHFKEHSPDTLDFVRDGFDYAKKHFSKVVTVERFHSVLEFFKRNKHIPHPKISPCSVQLKIEPIAQYCFENGIRFDLVGYIKNELNRRAGRQKNIAAGSLFDAEKVYPIGSFTDEWCFEIVDKAIGWHPKIYDIKDGKGNRLFKHNNCLPCKNMTVGQMALVKKFYPALFEKAMRLSQELGSYWGRDADRFYTEFGRDLGQDSTCENCKW